MRVRVRVHGRERKRKEKKKKSRRREGRKEGRRREGRNRLVRRGLRVMARVSEHRSSVQGNSDRISSQEAVMSMDGCGKAGLGCKPSGFLCFLCVCVFFFFFPLRGTCRETKENTQVHPWSGCEKPVGRGRGSLGG